MGEHAAVYGCPAVVASIGLRCVVTTTLRADQQVLLDLPDVGTSAVCSWEELLDYALNARERWIAYAAQATPQAFAQLRGADPAHLAKTVTGEVALRASRNHIPGVTVSVRSAIPPGAGFGSSAATAVSLAAALLTLLGISPSRQRLGEIAFEAERRQHGHPSGIDHNAVLLGGIVRAIRDASGALQVDPIDMTCGVSEHLLAHCHIYHTGASLDSTGAVVTAVRHRLNDAGWGLQHRMEQAAHELLILLEAPDAEIARFVAIVRRYESCLEELGVVPSDVQRTVRAVERAGGAAKVCGAGSLTGNGAGALLVVWPEAPPDPLPVLLARYPPVKASLAVSGCSVIKA